MIGQHDDGGEDKPDDGDFDFAVMFFVLAEVLFQLAESSRLAVAQDFIAQGIYFLLDPANGLDQMFEIVLDFFHFGGFQQRQSGPQP